MHDGTVPTMSERSTDYPQRIWRPLAADIAAAYEVDPLGDLVLVGLVLFDPTAAKMRSVKLRELERVSPESIGLHVIRQYEPPTPEQVAQMWTELDLHNRVLVAPMEAGYRQWIEDGIAATATAEELTRREGEPVEDFYRRVAKAHAFLSLASKRPTADLARRAGVPVGTATAWVSRARSRGLFEGIFDEEGQK